MFQINLSVDILIYRTLAASNGSNHDSSIVGDQNEGDEQPQRVSSYLKLS